MSDERIRGESGIWYENQINYVAEELLQLCGCRDDEIVEDTITVLKKLHNGGMDYRDMEITPPKYVELILHRLHTLDLIEHGTSIRYSWLTDEGIVVAEKLFGAKNETQS